MTSKQITKAVENQQLGANDPACRPSWREAPPGLLRAIEAKHRAAQRDGGAATLSFLNSVWGNGYTCTLDGLTPALAKLEGLTGAARWAKARELGIGSTTIRAEEDARYRHNAKIASGWNDQVRVVSHEIKRADEAEKQAQIEARARQIAAADIAAQRDAIETRARRQAEAEHAARGRIANV